MNKRIMMTTLAALLVVATSGCTIRYRQPADEPVVEEQDKDTRSHPGDKDNKDKGGPPPHAHGLLKIPKGHLPKPGMCRIWVPGTPPGHQRKAGGCATLAAQVPEGAWLVYRHADNPDRVDITVYDERQAGLIVEVRIFDVVTGEFLRHDEHTAKK